MVAVPAAGARAENQVTWSCLQAAVNCLQPDNENRDGGGGGGFLALIQGPPLLLATG